MSFSQDAEVKLHFGSQPACLQWCVCV